MEQKMNEENIENNPVFCIDLEKHLQSNHYQDLFFEIRHIRKQEGQDAPGSVTWIFEMTTTNFFFFFLLSEKNLQEFLYVCEVQVAPICYCHVNWQIKISQTVF